VRSFIADGSREKRTESVDRLLASPNYARHMANVFSVMFMERRADKVIPAAEWQAYLQKSIAENKPYNVLAREILGADGVDAALRPAAKFYLDRDGEPNLLTRDVGRIFFGRDLQCAQCHDHPIIDSYYQADYYGLLAFLNRGVLFTDPKDKKVYFAEKADGDVAFRSVFDPDAKGDTRPRLPGGLQLAEPEFAAGEEYNVKPTDGVRPAPKYSRRAKLALEGTWGANRAFNENIANRLWAQLLGRGLVEPVDLHHVDNPPSHPELLKLLTDELVAMKFDVKAFQREIVLSQTYQRAIDLPTAELLMADGTGAKIAALETELASLTSASGQAAEAVTKSQDSLRTARTAAVDAGAEVAKQTAAVAEAKKGADAASQALSQAQTALAAKQGVAAAVTEAATKTQAAAARLPDEKPLTEAAAKFKQRADQLAAEVAAASKAVADKTEPVKAATEKVAAAEKTVEAAVPKRKVAEAQVEALEATGRDAVAQLATNRAAMKQLERRLQTSKALLAYHAAQVARDSDQTALTKVDSELAGVKQSLGLLVAAGPAKKASVDEAERRHAEAVKALSDVQQQLAVKNDLAGTVAVAAEKAELARQKMTSDNQIAQAALLLKSRAAQLAAEAAETQKQVVERQAALNQAAMAITAQKQAVEAATADIGRFEQQIAALESQRTLLAEKLMADEQQYSRIVDELLQSETRQFATASLKPLTPEQLAWSVMRAVGLADQLRASSESELNSKTPLTDAIRNDPAQMTARARQIEEATYAKLQANAARFVELFGNGAGQPQTFFATADQALFLANDGQIRGWLAPGGGNLTERLSKLGDAKSLADELYLSILSRPPTEAEISETSTFLASRPNERPAAIQELAWALIASLEFRFNH
jgi:hypothetical protein